MNLLEDFTDQLHEWSISGKEPLLSSKDLRYYLDLQEKRLKKTGTIREEEYSHVKEEINGAIERSENGYSSKIQYREAVQHITYLKNGKQLKKIRRPVNLYVSFLDKQGHEDRQYTCPNCGNRMSALQARDGCPYCGTFFETDEIYPCVSYYYTVPGIVERASLMGNLKKEILICGILCGVSVFMISFFYAYKDAEILADLLISLFMGGLCGGVSAFLWYMMRSFILLIRVFFEAGRALPMLKTLNSRKKMLRFMEDHDPDFSYEAFEGRVISLLRTIVLSDDRDTLSIYESGRELSDFDDVVDMQYRGAVYVRKCEKIDDQLRIEGIAYLTDTYIKKSVHEKDEKISFILYKEADGHSDPGFSIHRVSCSSCGGSFDAMHQRNCPYCGSAYELKKKDWIVKEMKKI